MTIIRKGSQYLLISKRKGNILGVHGSKEEAQAQEQAIQIAKARKAGHNIPKSK